MTPRERILGPIALTIYNCMWAWWSWRSRPKRKVVGK